MEVTSLLERALEPLDGLRRSALYSTRHVAPLRFALARRDRRLTLLATLHVVLALVLAAFFPLVLLVLGPVLLGVAHVGADLRYLVFRRVLAGWWRRAIFVACASLIGLRVVAELRGTHFGARAELGLAFGWAALAVVAGAQVLRARGVRAVSRPLAALVVLAAAAVVCLTHPRRAELVLLHGHNLVALVLWAYLFRTARRPLLVPWGLTLVAALWLASGALAAAPLPAGGLKAFGLELGTFTRWLAPGVSAGRALGIASAYAFLQSVHYAVWLVFVPQEELPGQSTTSFRRSARSLLSDLGRAWLLGLAALALLVMVGAWVDVGRTRALYLSLATFHTYLELVLFAYFWVARAE